MISLEVETQPCAQGGSRLAEKSPGAHNDACAENDAFLSASLLKWATLLLMSYFGVRLVFFAVAISPFVPPDEVTHAGLCHVFSKAALFPDNSPASYEFGLVTNIPWLYYWLMGKLLLLNFFKIPELVFLRLLNIPLAFGTLFFARRTLLLLTRDRLAQLLLLAVITNTAMFSLLSASVSSDNLTNLLAAASIYFLFAFFKERSGDLLAASILCQLAGCLTKITFLPLALALNVLLCAYEFPRVRSLPAGLLGYFRTSTVKRSLLLLTMLLGLGMNLDLHARNYLRFGTLSPSMSDLFPARIATQYRIAARETIFREYSEGRISYMDALVMAGEIAHPGDKADTFYLLMNYENLKRNPQLWLGPLPYAKLWLESMMASVFGIKGHIPMFKDARALLPVGLLLALSLAGFLVRWRPRGSGWLAPCLAALVVFYAGFLFYKINYPSYLNYGAPGITLQGRYLFPVIAPFYALFCHYLLQLFRAQQGRIALALATALLFIAYDFPWFLTHATSEWYSWLPR